MIMSLNEKVALQQALDDVLESDRQMVCGELLVILLAALRQRLSENDPSLSEEVGRLLEQRVMTSVSDALVACFELDSLLPGISHVNLQDVRRDTLALRQLIPVGMNQEVQSLIYYSGEEAVASIESPSAQDLQTDMGRRAGKTMRQ